MIEAFFLVAILAVYIGLRLCLGRYLHNHHTPTTDELLCALALERGCSVYNIFKVAGKDWSYSDARIEGDFDRYLQTTDIPLYVRQFLRNQPPSHPPDDQHHAPLPLGPI